MESTRPSTTVTPTDIENAFLVLLGREPSPQAAVEQLVAMSPVGVLRGLAASAEFRSRVVESILSGERLPHERLSPRPSPHLIEWLSHWLTPPRTTEAALRSAKTWRALLARVLWDPACGPRIIASADWQDLAESIAARTPKLLVPGGDDDGPQPVPAGRDTEATRSKPTHAAPDPSPDLWTKAPAADGADASASVARQGRHDAPAPAADKRPASRAQTLTGLAAPLVAKLSEAPVDQLVLAWQHHEREILVSVAKRLFRARSWSELAKLGEALDF